MGVAVDVVLLIIFIICILVGAAKGAVRTLMGLVGLVAAVLLSPRVGTWLAGVLPAAKKASNQPLIPLVCTVAAFLLILVLAGLLGHLLNQVFQLPVLHTINRVFGGILGVVKGVLLVMLICALLRLALPFLALRYPKQVKTSDFQNSVMLQLPEKAASAASSGKKASKPAEKTSTAAGAGQIGSAVAQKAKEILNQVPDSVRNPVYTFYEKILREGVQAHATQK